MGSLRLNVLGRFEARFSSGEVLLLPTRKAEVLLTYLSMTPGQPHSRDRLMDLLWSDRGEDQARNSLRQTLSVLKKALDVIDPLPLQVDRTTASVVPNSIEMDTFELEGSKVTTDVSKLYRGELLEGIVIRDPSGEEWLTSERDRYRRMAVEALEDSLTYQCEAGEMESAVEMGERLVGLDTLRESAWRLLMQVYATRGERGQALKAYTRCTDILEKELGIEPELETKDLEVTIRDRSFDITVTGIQSKSIISTEHSSTVTSVPSVPVSSEKPTIAVLPFTNMSGDPEQEYFSDGITEDIITELTRFHSLFVIARHSSFTFRGKSIDIKEVGHQLGVEYVVEGSVRKAGNRVRVTALLVESKTGNHVWAERYDRELEDIFAVQDELVRTITSTVGGRVESAGLARAERLSEASLLAYDHVLRAKAAYLRSTKADNKYAREQLEQAIEFDPRNAQAHRELAEVLVMDWMAQWVEDIDAALKAAFNCAKTAVRLDDSYSGALATLASIKLYYRDFGDAQHDIERALELNPNDSQTLDLYALHLVAVGRTDDALVQHELSMRNNPFQPFWAVWLRGMAFFTARRYDEAIVTLRSIKDSVNEVRGWLAASYAGAGRLDEARAMLDEFLRIAEEDMFVFPGRKVSAWEDYWHGAIQYQDEADFEHLYDALRKAGLED